jgi:nicotinamidase/pyrazinamidase
MAKPMYLDVDTQNDFVLPAGALYAPGAERVIPVVAALNRFAMARGYGLVSTACLHSEDDLEFRQWPAHCVAGTVGQLKPAATLVGQLLFEKQFTDVFREARFVPLVQGMDASEFVVYGVVTEVCVRFAAEGLLAFGKPVTVVSDAIRALRESDGDAFLRRFRDAGGLVRSSAELQRLI